MAQIGNLHVGKADNAAPPTLTIYEAGIIWDFLSARYKCIEETSIYRNYAHDPDFEKMIVKIGMKMLESQVVELEKQCNLYGIPMPTRPPKGINQKGGSMNFSDEFMFRQIFEGCQHFIDHLGFCIKTFVHSDTLRDTFIDFFQEELNIFGSLCKYGKIKGWLEVPPIYRAD